MTRLRRFAASAWQAQGVIAALALLAAQEFAHAHSGPPFPIVTDAVRGPYMISIWTDPDATDDGSAGGQFWTVLSLSPKAARIPPETRVTVSVRAVIGRTQRHAAVSAIAAPVRGDMGNHFAGLVMDHEGPYEVRVMIDGPLGPATIDSRVDATYDLRPPAYMLAWYLVPFLFAGVLWTRLILRRRTLPRKR
jgi:hypothetical protein